MALAVLPLMVIFGGDGIVMLPPSWEEVRLIWRVMVELLFVCMLCVLYIPMWCEVLPTTLLTYLWVGIVIIGKRDKEFN